MVNNQQYKKQLESEREGESSFRYNDLQDEVGIKEMDKS